MWSQEISTRISYKSYKSGREKSRLLFTINGTSISHIHLQSMTKVLGTPGSNSTKIHWQGILGTTSNGIIRIDSPLPHSPLTMSWTSNDKFNTITLNWEEGDELINQFPDRYCKSGKVCQDFSQSRIVESIKYCFIVAPFVSQMFYYGSEFVTVINASITSCFYPKWRFHFLSSLSFLHSQTDRIKFFASEIASLFMVPLATEVKRGHLLRITGNRWLQTTLI